MTDYKFYTDTYLGGSIPETEFARLEACASSQLAQYKRAYTVTAPEETAEAMAVCAMADALYYFEVAANEPQSSSIGSVSSSRAAVDGSPRAQSRELYRCARLYLNIHRGCD